MPSATIIVIGVIADVFGEMVVGHVGVEDLLLAADLGDQKMVFVLWPDFARMRDRAKFDTQAASTRASAGCYQAPKQKLKTRTPPFRGRGELLMEAGAPGGSERFVLVCGSLPFLAAAGFSKMMTCCHGRNSSESLNTKPRGLDFAADLFERHLVFGLDGNIGVFAAKFDQDQPPDQV